MALSTDLLPDDRAGSMKSLKTSLRILLEFAGEQRDWGVMELAERCGLEKSRVSKVLDAFATYGLLVQDPDTRRYAVGAKFFAIGSRYLTHDQLCRAAIPVMRDLLNRTGHSVRLSVPDGDQALYVVGLEGALFADTGWRAGTSVPMSTSSAGRVLLAFMDSARAARLMAKPIKVLTDKTKRDKNAVQRLVAEVRVKGYATNRDETTLGLTVISVPIFDAQHGIAGALGLAFPSHLDLSAEEANLIGMLHQAARTISQRIGCDVYPFGGGQTISAPVNGVVAKTAIRNSAKLAQV